VVSNQRFVLQAHQDLNLTIVQKDDIEIVLLGNMLDPLAPSLDNRAILETLVVKKGDGRDVCEATTRMGGRWVILVSDSSSVIMFADPCGLRQIFFNDNSHRITWCASQPMHVARAIGVRPSEYGTTFLHVVCNE
jgi:hypothetical protein